VLPIQNILKQGDTLLPWNCKFALEHTITRVQLNQGGLKLNGTHQLLVYADGVNILGGSVPTIKENTDALVVASKEIGLEVNADKTKYKVMSRDQNAGRRHNLMIDNSFCERVEQLKYFGTALTYQNSIQEDKGMFVIIRCRIFCFPICYPKI
jgi:hypothetical protein